MRCIYALLPLAIPALSVAATYVVSPDGSGDFPTIQSAVNAASDGDVIELTDGVFTGNGNRDVNFLGKAITIRSQSGNASQCVVDCQGSVADPHRGFLFRTGEGPGSLLADITITAAYMPQGPDGAGAILVEATSPQILRCRLVGNRTSAIWGGSVSLVGPLIDGCLIAGNVAEYGGGVAIRWVGVVTISNCTITGNEAQGGGGMSVAYGDVVLRRTILWGNCADTGPELALGDGAARFYCCDVDSSGVELLYGLETLSYDDYTVFVDPAFCAPVPCTDAPTTAGDYHVDAASICLPAASPCGEQIGALGQACSGTIPVQERSWGGIKALYRR